MILRKRHRGPHSTQLLVARGHMRIIAAIRRFPSISSQFIFPIRDRSKGNFAQIDSQILERSDLSFRAKGILLYLLSRPHDWQVRISDIIKQGQEGRQAVTGGLKELENAGFIRRSRGLKPRQGDLWEVFEDPKMANKAPHNPLSMGARKIHRIAERTTPFTQIANSILTNENLRYASKGILAYLMSKPNIWRVAMKDVERHGTEGREAVRSSWAELQKAGHLVRRRGRSSITGRLKGYESFVFEDPNDPRRHDPTVGSPNDGKPSDSNPTDGNRSATKKDLRKKKNKKIPPISPPGGDFPFEFDPGLPDANATLRVHMPPDQSAPITSTRPNQTQAPAQEIDRQPPTRISDLALNQPINQGIAMKLVETDPLAQLFHALFPTPEWTGSLARMFCKRVKNGMVNQKALELLRWHLKDNGKDVYPFLKHDVLNTKWDEMRERLLEERQMMLPYYPSQLTRLEEADTGEFENALWRKAEGIKSTGNWVGHWMSIACDTMARIYVFEAILQPEQNGPTVNARLLDEESKEMVLNFIIASGAVFNYLQARNQLLDSEERFGFPWIEITRRRERLREEIQEKLRYLKEDTG